MKEEQLGRGGLEDNHQAPQKGRFSEAISRLLNFESDDSKDESTDSESKKKRKKGASKRWRRFFRGIFSRSQEVGNETSEDRKSSSVLPFISIERILSGSEIESKPLTNQESSKENPKGNDEVMHASNDLPQNQNMNEAPQRATTEKSEAQTRPEQHTASPERNDAQESVRESEDDGVLYVQHDEEELARHNEVMAQRAEARDVIDNEQPTRNIDRGARGLAVGLTGLEYLGRKRETRPLKKQVAKQSETLNAQKQYLESQAAELEAQNKKLEKLADQLQQRSKSHAEELKVKRSPETPQMPETRFATQQSLPQEKLAKQPVKSPESPNTQLAPSFETSKNILQESPEAEVSKTGTSKIEPEANIIEKIKRDNDPEVAHKAEELKRHEGQKAELEKKIAAASLEQEKVPAEKYFERRHEVKDSTSSSRAVPLSSILQSRVPQKASSVNNAQYLQTQKSSKNKSVTPPAPVTYASAVKGGFWTGIVIIAVAVTVFLLQSVA